jgi:GTP-binding protein
MKRDSGTTRLFVDQATIQVRGGRGGDGCVSFRREKYVPRGGPDGGDGGDGGSVYLIARNGIDTLLDLAGRHHWAAQDGRPGSGANRHGRRGRDCDVHVPTGTLVRDADSGRLLKDLMRSGQRICVARGGRGGRGNARFATSTHQTPREHEPGSQGQQRTLRLELKLIADAGLVGLPNAGKSTLLSRLTSARPKIADYPFTTRRPHLGIAELPGYHRLVLADIPGLIAGAHEGVGLGDAFLRHIERTRVIVHLVDLCPPPGQPTPADAYRIIRRELAKYSPRLAKRREIIVGTKLDLAGADDSLTVVHKTLGCPVLGVSAVTGRGLKDLLDSMWGAVQEVRQSEPGESTETIDLGGPIDADANLTLTPEDRDDIVEL